MSRSPASGSVCWSNVWPVWTALSFAVGRCGRARVLRAKRTGRGDLALALFFYAGIALGVVFAAKAGDLDLETLPYLFGDPLQMSTGALAAGARWSGVIVAVGIWSLRRVLFAVRIGRRMGRVEGSRSTPSGWPSLALTAAVIVAGMKVVGLLLMAAMMVLPSRARSCSPRSFRKDGMARGRDRARQRVRRCRGPGSSSVCRSAGRSCLSPPRSSPS
jgi:zinc transport system permease protein